MSLGPFATQIGPRTPEARSPNLIAGSELGTRIGIPAATQPGTFDTGAIDEGLLDFREPISPLARKTVCANGFTITLPYNRCSFRKGSSCMNSSAFFRPMMRRATLPGTSTRLKSSTSRCEPKLPTVTSIVLASLNVAGFKEASMIPPGLPRPKSMPLGPRLMVTRSVL